MTPKQQRFVEEYLIDLNATQAAIRAGYAPKRAYSIGHENLSKPEIGSAIAKQRELVSERIGRTVANVLEDIGRVRVSAMELVTDPETGVPTMRSHKDALRALELEGKHLGAFEQDNRQKQAPAFNMQMFFADLLRTPGQ